MKTIQDVQNPLDDKLLKSKLYCLSSSRKRQLPSSFIVWEYIGYKLLQVVVLGLFISKYIQTIIHQHLPTVSTTVGTTATPEKFRENGGSMTGPTTTTTPGHAHDRILCYWLLPASCNKYYRKHYNFGEGG